MRRLRLLLERMRGLVGARKLDEDMREQISAHLDEATEEYVRQGLSPAEARRAARLSFGSVVKVEEACRDLRAGWRQDLTKDLGYAIRILRRNPAFSTVAILSLGVGIAANSAIFSIVNSMLLRPRAISSPEQVVELYTGARQHPYETTSHPSYLELRERNQVLTGLAAYGIRQFTLGDANEVEQIWGEAVSGNYFDVLGVQPHHGRMFVAAEELDHGNNSVVVIAHGLWVRRFNSDPALIGRRITINGQQLTVVGIAPPRYTGMMRGLASEVWVPIMTMPLLEPASGRSLLTSGSRWLVLAGRLKPGTTMEQVKSRFDLLSREMQMSHPEEWRSKQSNSEIRELFVSVLSERETRIHPDMYVPAYAVVALLVVIINLVLVVACMNLANMLLARSVVRRKEVAVRLALGASRLRIVRQLLAESVLLSLVAGALGIVLAVWLLHLALAYMPAFPEGIRLALDVRLDWRVLLYTIAFSMATGILFGLVPALQSSRTEVSMVLKDDASAFSGGYRRSRLRASLLVAQMAFALLLLIGAGLVLRSLEKVRPSRLGFSSENVLVSTVTLNELKYDRRRSQEFYRQLSERLAALPGVQAVTLVEGMPGGFMSRARRSTEIEGYQPGPGESLEIDASFVGPRYFTNMKIPIVHGRDFDERDRDGGPCVAMVNETFSRRYFPDSPSPIGRRLAKFEFAPEPSRQMCEIVGVVRDNHWQSLQKDVRPFYWLPLQQSYRRRMSVLLHTDGDPSGQIAAVRRTVLELDPHIPINDIQTLREYFSATAFPFRLLGAVMGACGILALLLATIGVYGVVSYAVAQRTREVGIRIALGARPREILKTVVGQTMVLVASGLMLGLVLSFALTRVLTSSVFETELLFGVGATDSATFAGVTALLAVVAFVACCVPALRAMRLNPTEALRWE